MCGIAGYIYFSGKRNSGDIIYRMSREIAHRGPDDEGFIFIDTHSTDRAYREMSSSDSDDAIKERYAPIEGVSFDFPHNLAMAHRRFSIIDLSPSGHQPMWNRDRSLCVVFNGEIFNYIELREELKREGMDFETSSDTEVVLAAYRAWGNRAFERFSGFWAMSIYDRSENRLVFSRDRIGKKPLYFYRDRECFAWASEIKSLLRIIPADARDLNEHAIWEYLYYGKRDIGHKTFWKHIRMMDKSSFAELSPDGDFRSRTYWTLPENRLSETDITFDNAAAGLLERLTSSLTERLRADVPLAFELSGGMDSSAMVALRATVEESPFSVFTVKYSDKKIDEYHFARKVTEHYPFIEHNVINFKETDLWEFMPEFIFLQEEPFHDPNVLVSKLLRKKISDHGFKAIITGAGGDEVLAGYTENAIPIMKYLKAHKQYWTFFKNLMFYKERYPLRFYPIARILLNRIFKFSPKTYPFDQYITMKDGERSDVEIPKEINRLLISNMKDLRMHYWTSVGEKAAMSIPLETRSPFLAYQVVEYLFQIPVSYMMRNGWLKWLLRNSMKSLLPDEVLWRKEKQGYPFPLERWLMENRPTIEKILKESRNRWVDNDMLLRDYEILVQHHDSFFWRAVNFQLWHTRFVDNYT